MYSVRIIPECPLDTVRGIILPGLSVDVLITRLVFTLSLTPKHCVFRADFESFLKHGILKRLV